ncbi:class I SAM-dependent methyltransferase [Magnetovibrio sp. PR-2]|uniref:class I SAM-dependent methyltransferase n=1 Tax=Magnetovibrio sp. PR-2 TaxID=3120356 RepID=UPI002FCE0BE7
MSLKPPDDIGGLLNLVSRAYSHRIKECGPVPNGVFWKDVDGQELRLEVLLQAVEDADLNGPVSVNDLGCGYGTLFDLVKDQSMLNGGHYFGYDISPHMIEQAQNRIQDPRADFITSPIATEVADYSFVSGTYNMFFGADRRMWEDYVQTSLKHLWGHTRKTLAFNMLDNETPERLGDLYYANRRMMVEFALTLSPEVELINDYPLSEFTIFVKRV